MERQGGKKPKATTTWTQMRVEATVTQKRTLSLLSHEPMQVELTLNGIPVSIELDTGVAVSLINSSTYKKNTQARGCSTPY